LIQKKCLDEELEKSKRSGKDKKGDESSGLSIKLTPAMQKELEEQTRHVRNK